MMNYLLCSFDIASLSTGSWDKVTSAVLILASLSLFIVCHPNPLGPMWQFFDILKNPVYNRNYLKK